MQTVMCPGKRRLHIPRRAFLFCTFLFHELYYTETLHLRVYTHKRLKFLTLIQEPADIHKVVSINSRFKTR
jgi:hypothetical protein